jgi:hypothetical protein
MKEIKLNGVAFNLQAVANYKDAEDFYNSPSHQHYWSNVTEAERHKRLTFVYEQAKVCNVAPKSIEVRFENMNFTDYDASTANNKPKKSKRPRRNSKDAD